MAGGGREVEGSGDVEAGGVGCLSTSINAIISPEGSWSCNVCCCSFSCSPGRAAWGEEGGVSRMMIIESSSESDTGSDADGEDDGEGDSKGDKEGVVDDAGRVEAIDDDDDDAIDVIDVVDGLCDRAT